MTITASTSSACPDLVAEPADIWTLAALTDTIAILRSLAEVCGLDAVDDVLNATEGFNLLSAGQLAFTGRNGEKLWNEIGSVVAERWDEVVDALDAIVTTPEVDPEALEMGQAEAAAISAAEKQPEDAGRRGRARGGPGRGSRVLGRDRRRLPRGHHRRPHRVHPALLPRRDPVFLSKGGRIQIYSLPEDLENYLTEADPDHALATLAVWPDIRKAVADGEAAVLAGPENTYLIDDLDRACWRARRRSTASSSSWPSNCSSTRPSSATTRRRSTRVGSASPLGNLVGATIKPDPERQAPGAAVSTTRWRPGRCWSNGSAAPWTGTANAADTALTGPP